jgi:hypothetical protein
MSGRSSCELQPAIGQRLGDVRAGHLSPALKISEGSRHAQDPVVAAGRKLQCLDGLYQQGLTCVVGRSDARQKNAIGLGICPDGRVPVTLGLDRAGSTHAAGDIARAFSGWRKGQVLRTDGRDLDMKVDAIEKRP